jgi:hypothetical protein
LRKRSPHSTPSLSKASKRGAGLIGARTRAVCQPAVSHLPSWHERHFFFLPDQLSAVIVNPGNVCDVFGKPIFVTHLAVNSEFSQQQVGISGSLSPYKNAYSISVRAAPAADSRGSSSISHRGRHSTQMVPMSANMAAPSAAFALLALFGALCAARGAFAIGPPYSGGLRTSRTTSRTSRALSRGRRWHRCGRIALPADSARIELALPCWPSGCRAPLGRVADRGDCLAAATRWSEDTCGPPHARLCWLFVQLWLFSC